MLSGALTRNRRFGFLRSYLAHSAQALIPLAFPRFLANSYVTSGSPRIVNILCTDLRRISFMNCVAAAQALIGSISGSG